MKTFESSMDKEKFWTVCTSNQIMIDQDELQLLERYHDELLYWNKKINLISRKDEENIWSNHILHSLSILKYVDFKHKAKVMDIGTGGGLPGIPIKILRQDLNVNLVDSITKKMKATEMFAKHTGLKNIFAKKGRAEELNFNFKFDYIIARAVSRLANLMEWTKPHVTKQTKYVLLKGGDLTEEFNEAKSKFGKLNIKEIEIDLFGYSYFKDENKKIITVEFS